MYATIYNPIDNADMSNKKGVILNIYGYLIN